MTYIRKVEMRISEEEILERLEKESQRYTPLVITRLEKEVVVDKGRRIDAIAEFSIQDGPSFRALVEVKSLATPKIIDDVCQQITYLLQIADRKNLVPLFVAPYVGREQANRLAKAGISWIDLSGNMIIRVAGQVYIERTGKPNMFPDTVPIRKIFQGSSSLVSRALLLKPEGFSSLYELADFINSRNASITIPTISKVLKALEDELLITKKKNLISVDDPEKLLGRLAKGYADSVKRQQSNRYRFAIDDYTLSLLPTFWASPLEYAACEFYAAKLKGLTATEQVTLFVKSLDEVKKTYGFSMLVTKPDAEFGQLTLIETKEPSVWFNIKNEGLVRIVDDIELYLEMTLATPRGPEIAEQLKQQILKKK
jgi:hypothetical protein